MPTKDDVIAELLSRGIPAADIAANADPQTAARIKTGALRAPNASGDPVLDRQVNADAGKKLNDSQTALNRVSGLEQQLQALQKLNTVEPTGGVQHMAGPWGINPLQVFSAFDPEIQSMQSITAPLQGAARTPGSGATSDFEQRLYRQGVPSVEKLGKVNDSIIAYQRGVLQEERDRVAFAQEFQRLNRGSLNGFDEAWANYTAENPYTKTDEKGAFLPVSQRKAWRDYFGLATAPAAAPARSAQPRRPAGPVSGLSPQQNALLGLTIGAPGMIMGSAPQPRQQAPRPAAKQTSSAPPRAGQVVDGYRFKGGDPSKPANWVKQ